MMVITATHFASQTAVIHVLPMGATHEDFLRSNAVVPVATYAATPVSRTNNTPNPACVAEVQRLHPGHELSYVGPGSWV
jgi:predicted pyridoxine 5'-phosphate oxidase superfamily flavin-nucleotide-binding protein